ncbi:MAG: hypothetical protein MMC33_003832 [Icmadophila ericetorum]|nr:hypothetical protein [Icmadophila ericetorum]
MTELSFAKSFLAQLDTKPIKLQSDYAADLKDYVIKGPYTLPRMPTPMRPISKSTGTTTAGPSGTSTATTSTDLTLSITLKSLRNPPLDLHLTSQPLTTSILELKQLVAAELKGVVGVDKIRLLWKKKPCGDSKSLKDLLGDEVGTVREAEFGVMVMGGVPATAAAATAGRSEKKEAEDVVMGGMTEAEPVAQGLHGKGVLDTEEFWTDLRGFLTQRVRDEGIAERAWAVFRDGWEKNGGM